MGLCEAKARLKRIGNSSFALARLKNKYGKPNWFQYISAGCYVDTDAILRQYSNMLKQGYKIPNRPFSTKQAVALGISKTTLTRLVRKGIIERISRGVYQVSEEYSASELDGNRKSIKSGTYTETERDYVSATLRCGSPSAICLLSALEHYNLTDEIPNRIWVMVPETKRVRSDALKIIRCRNPRWDLGFHKNKDYWMTTLERTLIDCVVYKKIVGQQVALSALKLALRDKKINLGDLYDLARRIGVARVIKPYIEILGA